MMRRFFYPDLTNKILSSFNGLGFILNHTFQAGYHMLEFSALIPDLSIDFLLIFKISDNNAINYSVKYQQGKSYKRIINLPERSCCLYIEINNSNGLNKDKVMLSFFRLIKLRKHFALKRMARRLGKNWSVFRNKFYPNIDDEKCLFLAYNQIFSQDIGHEYKLWMRYIEPGLINAQRVLMLNEEKRSEVNVSIGVLCCADSYQVSAENLIIMENMLIRHPNIMVVYPDEDLVTALGKRLLPNFKPDWNIDLFFSIDYVSNCCVIRRSWYEENADVFEKYGDRLAVNILLLRIGAANVLHIPLVLAHRLLEKKTHDKYPPLKRANVLFDLFSGDLTSQFMGLDESFRATFSLPEKKPMISLLIPTRNQLSFLKKCVESILNKTTYSEFEIIIINNKSEEADILCWFSEISRLPNVRVVSYNSAFNYSAINNFGVKHAKGSIIGLINNDVEVISPDWLTEMVSHACRSEIGCVGAKLYYGNGQIQHAGIILSEHNVAMHGHRCFDGDADGYQGRLKLVQNYSAVTGACLVVRKEIYEQVGGLNEKHLAVAYNDVDFCLKVGKAGYRNLWTPYAELYHHESISRGSDDTPAKRKRLKKEAAYMRKVWAAELANDPCYNPNLTPLKEDFSLRVI